MDQPVLKYTYADGRKASEFELRNGAEVRYVQQPDGTGGWYEARRCDGHAGCRGVYGILRVVCQGFVGDCRVIARRIFEGAAVQADGIDGH